MEPETYDANTELTRAIKTCRVYMDGMPLLEALEAIQVDLREWEEYVPLDVRQSYWYIVNRLRPMFAPACEEDL